jgi:hypothetical protein
LRFAICDCRPVVVAVIAAALFGCAHRSTPGMQSPDASSHRAATTQPILYHRTGGIAGTDDRVVIWPDGLVNVNGKILPAGSVQLSPDRLDHLKSMFAGWEKLRDSYRETSVPDAYTITIFYGEKSVEALDLAPDLPPQFRQLFGEIESIANEAIRSSMAPATLPVP